MAGGSKVAVYAAIGGNFLISIMKFVASFFTGSAAMLSEGIHSLIDTFNGILLLYGIKRRRKSLTSSTLLVMAKKFTSGVSLSPFSFSPLVAAWPFMKGSNICCTQNPVTLAIAFGIMLYWPVPLSSNRAVSTSRFENLESHTQLDLSALSRKVKTRLRSPS